MKLIVEMEMPTNCNECEAKCVSALCGRICGMTRKNIMPFLDKPNRPDWCPIVGELPDEHGDLIDRSLLCADFAGVILSHSGLGIAEVIARQPAIIAAERKDDGK